jgi:hypothetical protein
MAEVPVLVTMCHLEMHEQMLQPLMHRSFWLK